MYGLIDAKERPTRVIGPFDGWPRMLKMAFDRGHGSPLAQRKSKIVQIYSNACAVSTGANQRVLGRPMRASFRVSGSPAKAAGYPKTCGST